MIPFFPSLPGHVQAQASNDPALQQAMLLNPPQFPSSSSAHQNPTGFNRPPRPPPLPHGQNPRFRAPTMNNFNTQKAQFNNSFHRSNAGIPNRPNSVPPPCFPNAPNVQPMNHMGIPPAHFGPQLFPPQNVNQVMAALQVLQQNLPQFPVQNNPLGQLHNNNLTAFLQPGGLFCAPNMQVGQLCLQNPSLSGNQISPFQFPQQHSASGIQPLNIPPSSQPLMASAISHNPGIVGNPQMALAGPNSNFGQSAFQGPPAATQKSQPSFPPSPMQAHQTWKNMQPNRHQQRPVNHVHGYGKSESTNMRFQKSIFHHAKNTKGNMNPFIKNGRIGHVRALEGYYNVALRKISSPQDGYQKRKEINKLTCPKQAQTEQRRPLPVFYTEKEIQQWREARKKNFPISGNKEKSLTTCNRDQEITDGGAKLRRQQLKEVLAKQAELGVEVAEIPSSYLSEPVEQTGTHKRGRSSRSTDVRPLNKHNKKRKQRNSKKPKLGTKASATSPIVNVKKREPTLLQKLMSTDIRRDKSQLLQVFRFMVSNSFFERCPNKPLEFPAVMAKGTNGERDDIAMEDGPSLGGVDVAGFDVSENAMEGEVEGLKDLSVVDEDGSDDDDDDSDGEDGGQRDGGVVNHPMTKGGHLGEQYEKSEEGEITE